MNDLVATPPITRPMGLLLLFAAQRVEARYESALGEISLSLPKLAVLKHLVEADEPLPLSRLADRMSCVKSNITQLVDRLEAEGLVARVGDSVDRRCVRASITSTGRERFDRGAAVLAGLEEELFRGISEGDRARIVAFLTSFVAPCGGA